MTLASLPSQERETLELIVKTFGAVLVENATGVLLASDPTRTPRESVRQGGRAPLRPDTPAFSASTASQPPEGEQQMSLVNGE